MRKLCLLIAVLFAPAAGASYKCVDEKGVTRIGDTPPAECANVIMYETSPSGTVLRKIDPTPTEEQLKAKEEEFERAKEAIRTQAEQKRKDTALLNTFSAEREFDVVRDRQIEPITGRIKSAQDRIKAVEKRQAEIQEEMEFYKAGKSKTRQLAPPAQLAADLERFTKEQSTLKNNIVGYEKEIEQLRAKFEVDKKRWVELKGNANLRNKPAPAKPAVAGTLIPGAAGLAKCGERVYECQAGEVYTCRRGDGKTFTVNCVVERK